MTTVMDLAQGHVLALSALDRDSTFAPSPSSSSTTDAAKDLVRYKAYNLGKGKGMSVLQMVKAMKDASGFDYVYEIIGRRYVSFCFSFFIFTYFTFSSILFPASFLSISSNSPSLEHLQSIRY